MPRKRKPQPAQAQAEVYGEGQELIDAQKQIPIPDGRGEVADTISAPPTVNPAVKMEAALAAAANENIDQQLAINAPSNRPDQPVTTGLPVGPGAGPEAIGRPVDQPRQGSVTAFFAIAADTFGGDPVLAEFSQRASRRGA